MTESLDVVLKGKSTLIKNKQYLATKDYVQPFIDRFTGKNATFICNVKRSDQISVTDGVDDTVYNKVMITAILPDVISIGEKVFNTVVTMAYALDTKVPVVKFYSGVIDKEDRFFQFGRQFVKIQKIEDSTPFDLMDLDEIIKKVGTDNCHDSIRDLMHATYGNGELIRRLGTWVDYTLNKDYITEVGKVKLASSLVIDTYKNLTIDQDSDFYSFGKDVPIFNVMASMIDAITNDEKDLINRFEKTLLVSEMLTV